jgi:propionyl-CoA carboxylase beta chain
LTARERIELLLDKGPSRNSTRSSSTAGRIRHERQVPGDGVVIGWVRSRPKTSSSPDFTVFSGSLSETHAKIVKSRQAMKASADHRALAAAARIRGGVARSRAIPCSAATSLPRA